MTNYLSLTVAFFVLAIAAAIVYFCVLQYNNYLYPKTERNRLTNSYGYEYYSSFKPLTRGLLYTLIGIDGICLALGFFFYFMTDNSVYSYCLAFIYIISIVCLILANVIPLSHPYAHLVTASAGILFMGVATLLISFSDTINDGLRHMVNMGLGVSITLGIIGAIVFLAMFNPKLLDWAKMDKTEVDGVTVYVKPKINWLSLYEWITLILYHIVGMILFINVIVTGQVG